MFDDRQLAIEEVFCLCLPLATNADEEAEANEQQDEEGEGEEGEEKRNARAASHYAYGETRSLVVTLRLVFGFLCR
jgi:hypothetical protein